MPNTTIQTLENLHKLIVSQLDAIPDNPDEVDVYTEAQRQAFNEVANLIEQQILKESDNKWWVDPVIERRYISSKTKINLDELTQLVNSYSSIEEFAQDNLLKLVTKSDVHILNYDEQKLKTPKTWVSHYCRGITFKGEPKKYKIIAKGFDRFYNIQESPEYLDSVIDWTKPFEVQFKYDGSVIFVYKHDNKIKIQTRGSFANGSVSTTCTLNWEDLFYSANPDLSHSQIQEGKTYVYELCSPHNQIVEKYDSTFCVRLGIINTNGTEVRGSFSGKTFNCNSLEEVMELLKTLKPEQEGFVIAQWDNNKQVYNRVKCKTKTWVELSNMRSGLTNDSLWNIVFTGEIEEVIALFPHLEEKLRINDKYYADTLKKVEEVYSQYKDIKSQKDFAIAISKIPFKSILFLARQKGNVDVLDVQNWIIKNT